MNEHAQGPHHAQSGKAQIRKACSSIFHQNVPLLSWRLRSHGPSGAGGEGSGPGPGKAL